MKEKNHKKILLLVSVIIIVIVASISILYYIYKISTETVIVEKQVVELDAETEIKGEQNNLKENSIDYSAANDTSNSSNDIKNSNEFSENDIKTALQNYLELIGIREGSPEGLLVKLGLCNYSDYDDSEKTSDNYIKTNIQYSEYKEKMLNYVTEEWFNTEFTKEYKDVDGVLYFLDGGATGLEFEVKDITIKGDSSDLSYIANVYNIHVDESKELENIEFHIANKDGKCVISYCD